MSSYHIIKLIEAGENQQLDFKFEISDSRKIARTLVAFSNTDGGTLLVGVKDNGAIAGVRTEEEFYMIEAAASMYCKPEVRFETREWEINGKIVFEVIIPKGKDKPYLAGDNDNKWLAYIRVKDQNFLANRILLKVWERQQKGYGTTLMYTKVEKILLQYLEEHPSITLSAFRKLAAVSRFKAENVLINMLCLDVLDINFTEHGIFYKQGKAFALPDKEKNNEIEP